MFAIVDIGASGAPTISRAQGIASVARNSAGLYTITLQDKYNALMHVSVEQLLASGPLDAPIHKLVSEDVDGVKTIVIQFYAIDNSTATDPDNGAKLLIKISCRNATAN
jgi:hypothetical protein